MKKDSLVEIKLKLAEDRINDIEKSITKLMEEWRDLPLAHQSIELVLKMESISSLLGKDDIRESELVCLCLNTFLGSVKDKYLQKVKDEAKKDSKYIRFDSQ